MDKRIHPAEFLYHLIAGQIACSARPDIALQSDAIGSGKLSAQLICSFNDTIAGIKDCNARTILGQHFGCRTTNTVRGSCAGNDAHLLVHKHE
jgi:hypothetical protein